MTTYCDKYIIHNNNNKRELPWIEKYRPKCIEDIISQDKILLSLVNFIKLKTIPHLLFFGPSGTGKTTSIDCCAKQIYGDYVTCMTLRLNASNERGIETVRTIIKNFVANQNSILLPAHMRGIFKLVILDEIDSMTVEAQGMLRQTIEKNSKTTRFCLICNDIDKINVALQSRCALYRFSPLNVVEMERRLYNICTLENICYDVKAIRAIVTIAKGDMRSAINTLQYINLTIGENFTEENVHKILGYCIESTNNEIFDILMNLSTGKVKMCDAVNSISDTVIENNITIFNLLEEIKNLIFLSKMTTNQKIFIVDNLATNEIYDSVHVDQKNIIMIICCLFVMLERHT